MAGQDQRGAEWVHLRTYFSWAMSHSSKNRQIVTWLPLQLSKRKEWAVLQAFHFSLYIINLTWSCLMVLMANWPLEKMYFVVLTEEVF